MGHNADAVKDSFLELAHGQHDQLVAALRRLAADAQRMADQVESLNYNSISSVMSPQGELLLNTRSVHSAATQALLAEARYAGAVTFDNAVNGTAG